MDRDTLHAQFKKSGIHNDDKIFVAPHIPEKKLINAIQSHGLSRKCNMDDVLVLVDDTVFGSAKESLIVTSNFISCKEIFQSPWAIDLEDISDVDVDGAALSINSKTIKFTCPEKSNIYKLYTVLRSLVDDSSDEYEDESDEDEENQEDSSIDLLSLQLSLVQVLDTIENESNIFKDKVRKVYLGVSNSRASSNEIVKKSGNCAIEVGYYYARFLLYAQLKLLVDEFSPEISDLEEAGAMNYLKSLLFLCNLFDKRSNEIKMEINNYYSDSFINKLEKEIKTSTGTEKEFLEKFKEYFETYAGFSEIFQAAYDNKQYFQASFFGLTQFVVLGAIYYILQLSRKSKNLNDKNGLLDVFRRSDLLFDKDFWNNIVKSEYAEKVFR